MKSLIATFGVLSLLAGASAAAESVSGDKTLTTPISGVSAVVRMDNRADGSRVNDLRHIDDDGVPVHWFNPQIIVVDKAPRRRTRDPFARSHLFDEVEFRSDGDLGEQVADQYDGLGRSLSTKVFGEKRGENVRFKRVDDGVGISIAFD